MSGVWHVIRQCDAMALYTSIPMSDERDELRRVFACIADWLETIRATPAGGGPRCLDCDHRFNAASSPPAAFVVSPAAGLTLGICEGCDIDAVVSTRLWPDAGPAQPWLQ
jgi:hypothetical protein